MLRKATFKQFAVRALPLFFATGALVANAQDTETDIEEVTVTGFRKSLETAVDAKRNAKNVTDNIFAEDIGKSTDQNIAEALSRVTGVSINREDGEGTTISIRGAGPGLNNISLNGVQLTGFELNNNAVDLSAYSSDILSQVEIFKTSSADHDEGSLGGTVRLKTFRPLDAKEDRRSIELQSRYNSLSRANDYKLSGAFSHKFLDDTLGLSLTLYNETQTVRKDQYESGRTAVRTFDSDKVKDQNDNLLTSTSIDAEGNEVVDKIKGLAFFDGSYQSFINDRDRVGGSLGIQFKPADQTNIQFDLSHSTQTVKDDNNGVRLINLGGFRPPSEDAIRGYYTDRYFIDTPSADRDNADDLAAAEAHAQWLVDNPPSATDPVEDWTVFDTERGMFTKLLSRYGVGRVRRQTSIVDNINTIASLDIEHTVGAFTFNILAGHSESEAKDDFYADANSMSFNTVNSQILYGVSAYDIQPVGLDCTSGRCAVVTGSDGLRSIDNDPLTTNDNSRSTAFNPDDFKARHLQQFGIRDRTVTDTSDSFFADVDWDIDTGIFTTLEAGFKYSSREKDVADTRAQFAGRGTNNDRDIRLKRPVAEILVSEVTDSFAIDGFLGGLGFPQDHLTDGWASIDARKAAEVVLDGITRVVRDADGNIMMDADGNEVVEAIDPYTQIKPNRGATRNITVDATSLYLKANFDVADWGLSGDFGVRYVKTENNSSGFSSIQLSSGDEVLDLELFDVVTDQSLSVCNTSGMFAVDYEIVADEATYNALSDAERKALTWNPVTPGDDPNAAFPPELQMAHQEARDKEARNTPCFDPLVFARIGNTGDVRYNPIDRSVKADQEFFVVGSGSNNQILPSLNLNYDISDSLTGRLAISKTMARPNMNSLQPGFTLRERLINSSGNGNVRNPDLDPLISKNLDLALEWYFNDNGGLISATYFRKDFEDFEETESAPVFIKDTRGQSEAELDGSPAEDFILSQPEAGCFLNRPWMFGVAITSQEAREGYKECRVVQVDKIVNGEGAKVNGLELAYQQNYDMLPGVLGGLGVAINATFQKTETARQESALLPGTFLPQFPLARSPETSFNSTIFWEQDGNLIRLAYNWADDVLVQRSYDKGFALWEEGGGSLDLSATWAVNDWLSVNLNAVNLTDRETTTFITSVSNPSINGALGLPNGEGSALDGGANKNRIRRVFHTGRVYRLGLRATF